MDHGFDVDQTRVCECGDIFVAASPDIYTWIHFGEALERAGFGGASVGFQLIFECAMDHCELYVFAI